MINDASMKLGALVSEWRASAGLSQADLAELTHTQQATMSKIESGSYKLTVIQLLGILNACGLKLSDVADEIEQTLHAERRPLWERIDE